MPERDWPEEGELVVCTVDAVKDDSVVLKVDENVKIRFSKSAVSQVLNRGEVPADTRE